MFINAKILLDEFGGRFMVLFEQGHSNKPLCILTECETRAFKANIELLDIDKKFEIKEKSKIL